MNATDWLLAFVIVGSISALVLRALVEMVEINEDGRDEDSDS